MKRATPNETHTKANSESIEALLTKRADDVQGAERDGESFFEHPSRRRDLMGEPQGSTNAARGGRVMKTFKAIGIVTLAAAVTLVPLHAAWAHRSHHHHHHHDDGAVAGAALGGTAFGLAMGSMMSQPSQPAPQTQPQVVVVQQPTGDSSSSTDQDLALKIERERQKNLELEKEILKLKAEQANQE